VSTLLKLVRRLATAPGFRRLTRFKPLLRVSFALRGSLVQSPLRFALNEVRPGSGLAVYRLRNAEVSIALRHKTPDILVLDEIFSQREYELPERVRPVLSRSRRLRVVDLGANIGLFGAFISTEYPQTEIVAVEADPLNAAVHERTIAANRRAATWKLVEAFAAPSSGTVRFATGDFSLSRGSVDGVGAYVRAVDAFSYLLEADLVKMDIEGAEWPILADPRFSEIRAPVVVLEYHEEGCPGSNPAAEAEQAVQAAGYETIPGTSKPAFGAGILWGFRRD